MKRFATLLAACAVLFTAALPASAQTEPLQVDAVDVSGYPEATATVTAPRELVGTDLTADAFTVREGGRQRSVTVTQMPSDDLEIVLALDTSGSMVDAMDSAKDAAMAFIDRLPAGVHVSVLGFGTEPAVGADFTTDKDTLKDAVAALEPRGETALYDAVGAALDQFPDGSSTRRSIVLLSDGGDTVSSTTLDDATNLLGDNDVTLYAVELQSAESDPEILQQLAGVTDGRMVSANDADALTGVYEEVLSALVNQYILSFELQGQGQTKLQLDLNKDGVRRSAEKVVELPIPSPEVELPGEPATVRVLSTDTENFPEVELRVLAPRQLSGRELNDDAFTVTERGRDQPATVTRIDSVDLEVVLMLDTSGSMQGEPLSIAKEAASQFLDHLPSGTQVALQTFSEEQVVAKPMTTDLDAIREAIQDLEAGGETALYDAADAAAGLFTGRDGTARTIVLLTDGGDTVSETTFDQAAARFAAENVNLQVVQIESPEADVSGLRELAEPVGGAVTAAKDDTALQAAYRGVAADVANQYILRYESTANGPTQLRVTVSTDDVRAQTTRNVELPPAGIVAGLLASKTLLYAGLASCYIAMALVILLLLAPAERRTQLAGAAARLGTRKTGLAELANRVTAYADQTLIAHGWSGSLNAALERAGINLRPGEFVVLAASAMVAATAVGLLLGGILLALILVIIVGLTVKVGLKFLGDRRAGRFAEQLSDTLQLLAGSLRAGYGIMQAIDSVSREADDPTADEFRRLMMEVRLGRDLNDALDAMAIRIGNEDFQWIVQAMEIHREIGGDLAEVLETVAGTIRERDQIRRQVKALSAEGRLSAYILLALPFGVGFMIYLSSPDYIGELTNGGLLGWGLIGIGLFLMTVGALWLKKITKLVF